MIFSWTRSRSAGALAWLGAAALSAFAVLPAPAFAQDLKAFEEKTTVHVLENGWTFVIVERPVAPVFSFATYVDAGSAREVAGITGLAHMFEHMAFKGTPNIGTSDFEAEIKAIEELETAYRAMQRERLALNPDVEKLQELTTVFEAKQAAADGFVVLNEFGDIIDREGGAGLNAFTAADFTGYFYSLPANKLELFAYLESERFLYPVFREFYKERDVVKEERRLRIESQPFGRLIEQWVATAFVAHPYKNLGIGHMSDLNSITLTDGREFFKKYYVPANMVTAIVGQVESEKVIPLLEKYFGRIPARPKPPELRTIEPPQIVEKTIVLEDPSQPIYLESYHKPGVLHPDQAIYDAIDDIMSRGRTSRLYRRLVRDEKIAVVVQSFSGFPGEKYPNLWGVFALPARGISNDAVRDVVREEIELLKDEQVTAEELEKFKTRARADLLGELDSNAGLADQLARYQTLFQDWRQLFHYLDALEAVTAEDIQRVARETFRDSNRTVAMIVTESVEDSAPAEESANDS